MHRFTNLQKSTASKRSLAAATSAVIALCAMTTPLALAQDEGSDRDTGFRTTTPEVDARVEAATRRGLAWLADHQSKAGFWAGDVGYKVNASYRVTAPDAEHVGITALALMAFLACGEVPGRGKYGDNVERATRYLIASSQENGYMTAQGSRMYSHAFATLALAEVYGMTKTKELRDALQRSVQLIADSQNREGGWRYKPFAQESDMSITVCQVMALRASRNAGIFVSKNVIGDAVKYVRESARNERESEYWRSFRNRELGHFNSGVFKYQKRADARASFALTAAGVTTLYGAGIYEDPLIDRGLEFMLENQDEYNRIFDSHYFFFYGNYYAVQAFYIAGGRRWKDYYFGSNRTTGIADYLTDRQASDGSWSCEVGPGTSFATAVSTLILAIPFQYLPIFQR